MNCLRYFADLDRLRVTVVRLDQTRSVHRFDDADHLLAFMRTLRVVTPEHEVQLSLDFCTPAQTSGLSNN